jgi:hypothetical protein
MMLAQLDQRKAPFQEINKAVHAAEHRIGEKIIYEGTPCIEGTPPMRQLVYFLRP